MDAEMLKDRARTGQRESKYLDFKQEFDPTATADWCEIIKDIVAMANSGGGMLVFGVTNAGASHQYDASKVLDLDPAVLTDKVRKYTGVDFHRFEILEVKRKTVTKAAILVHPVERPLLFEIDGAYQDAKGREKTAFRRGTLYVRHGAKSEPARSADFSEILDAAVERVRATWLDGIRRVTTAPPGSVVHVVSPADPADVKQKPMKVQITTEEGPPKVGVVDYDTTHPYRTTELVDRINELLDGKHVVNQYDITCIKVVHDIDAQPDLFHMPKFGGSPQYSEAFADWVCARYAEDPLFFDEARKAYREQS